MNQKFFDLLKPEEKLLVLLSKLTPSDSDRMVINTIIPGLEEGQWLRFYDFGVRHKVLNFVIRNATQMGISLHNKQWSKLFTSSMHANEIRNKHIYEEITPILFQMEACGIEYAALKGLHLNNVVYKDYSLRQSNDVDILVKDSCLSLATDLLISKGFVQSKNNLTLEPASKKLKRFYRLSTHELVPFLKRTDNPFCPIINVDVQFDIIGRSKNLRIPLPYEDIFKKVSKITLPSREGKINTLSSEFALLQLCSHLYRDMTRIQDILSGRDLKLINFLDIYQFIGSQRIEWKELYDFCTVYNVNHILYYALHYTNLVYPCNIPEWFLTKIAPDDISYLNQYGFEEKQLFEWQTPFHIRMFGKKHKEEVERISPEFFKETNKFAEGLTTFL
ncbi:nucleotidyltransferase family protein [Paenibacillus lautus]|uniref:nucleotidyltransferase family protein n=1 Tax=Paenibacillus lautus TaxID=1401 RepID=UPI003D2BC077